MPVQKKRVRHGRATRRKVLSTSDPKFQLRFEKARRTWEAKLLSLAEAARSSEQLSEHDMAVRINARA